MNQLSNEVTRLTFQPDTLGPYRMVIRDETVGDIIIKDVIETTSYDFDWREHDPTHIYRWRVQTKGADGWENTMGYRPIQPTAAAAQARHKARAAFVPSHGTVRGPSEGFFLFTVDTEVDLRRRRNPDIRGAVDDHIFAKVGDREVGICYMMDLLDARGMKGVFFVDVFMEYLLGREALERTIEAIATRGHDIQLHLHTRPHLLCAESPTLRELNDALYIDRADQFRRALEQSVRLFEQRVGVPPVAYRAGSYMIREFAFAILAEFDIRIDSSIWPFKHCEVGSHWSRRTQPHVIDGVLELPITWLIHDTSSAMQARQFTTTPPIDYCSAAMLEVLHLQPHAPFTWVNMLLHSHTFLEHKPVASIPDHERVCREWIEEFRRVNPERVHEPFDSERVFGSSGTFYDGVSDRRICTACTVLDAVHADSRIRTVTCRDIVEQHWETFTTATVPPNAVPVWRERGEASYADLTYTCRFDADALEAAEHLATEAAS